MLAAPRFSQVTRSVRKRRECSLGSFLKRACLCGLLLQAIDDVSGSLRDKSRIVQLLLGRLQAFVILVQLLVQAFAFGGNIDLSLVYDRNIEVRRRARVVAGRRLRRKLDAADARKS